MNTAAAAPGASSFTTVKSSTPSYLIPAATAAQPDPVRLVGERVDPTPISRPRTRDPNDMTSSDGSLEVAVSR